MRISSNRYIYDNIGNLIKDVSEEIDTIVWNVYGKIERVVRTSSSSKSDLEFRYDAMPARRRVAHAAAGGGNRICKIVKPRAGAGVLSQDNWTYTYYLRDASGNVIAVYDRDFEQQPSDATFTDELAVKEQHLYGSSRVGIRSVDEVVATTTYNYSSTASNGTLVGTYAGMNSVAASTTNWTHELKRKSYELSNHLGNVLVTVSDARTANNSGGTITTFNAVVESAQDYYAFGSTMVGRSVSGDYRYSFNGKEKDSETDLQDYGFRIYNQRLGKFLSVDPIAIHYPMLSTYQFASNTPIMAVDLDGMEAYFIHGTLGSTNAFTQVPNEGDVGIRDGIRAIFGNTPLGDAELIKWSGHNNSASRKEAAQALYEHIVKTHVPGEPITLVGHSHGGNVAILAADLLAKDPTFNGVEINIVTLNTPVRDDYEPVVTNLLKSGRVTHYHIYNPKDLVVPRGGYANTGIINDPSQGSGKNSMGAPIGGESGPAGYTFNNGFTINISYLDMYQYNPRGFGDNTSLATGHRGWKTQNVQVWMPKLKAAAQEQQTQKIYDRIVTPEQKEMAASAA